MGETVTSSNSRMENLTLELSKYPRNLLQSFLGSNNNQSTSSKRVLDDLNIGEGDDVDEDNDGINLGLGLSLGGKFGVDKSHKGLKRSSSIVGTMPLVKEEGEKVAAPPVAEVNTLVRTASLPVESEEEWRKRKEIQTLRRMEAKRRRSEKQRVSKDGGGCGAGCGGSSMVNPFGLSSNVEVKRRTTFGSLHGFLAQAQQGGSQGSGESQGGNSSGAVEQDSKTHLGSSSCGEAKSSASIPSSQERGNQDTKTRDESRQTGCGREANNLSKQLANADSKKREAKAGGVEDMPCVFTIGDGPNGRKVEGILYRFGKGEEVRIMCVCHGSFLSPAEFVKHAGGRDVEHPLRHIVVSPSVSPFQ